ncbi:GTPase-associated protein 1-related protein [Streptomyces sp. ME19-01-6]|uniref:GTPase-associated protein 1-related protein n=1 Tax=Streptomyces sp. ME19-01-6 TaxID=3028686 RepID=UPI0029A3B496|nr:GTPase-associated protein 1-related protein [Streptomyces sp. ME19-01-6]MDX3233072.1 GTPase-associated protein 1-related protein [Streptomyces sp. ME19-01-6]
MSLAQLHYTSAPPGPDGSGSRFTAVSPGVPPSLLGEAEQLLGYEPPHDAPPRPSDFQPASFPEVFSYSLLSDGSGLLARTVYTGADHSGRWGNFHAHAVHLPTGAPLPGGALPITAWGSPQWATRTPEGGVPEPLEALTASGRMDRDGLVAFAGSRAPWLARFFADLRRLSEDESAPQIVLVEQDSADVARWIALACAALPRDRAHRLTFTTYTRRPELSRQQIIGVRPEDDREPTGLDHRYRVYDVAGRKTGEPVSDAWAQAAAGIWLGGAPELFKEADALPGGQVAPGTLAVAALCAGLDLGTTGRTEAANWARHHPEALSDDRLHRLLAALCVPAGARPEAEKTALTGLFTCLDGRVPTAVSTPLAALVLTEAVHAPAPGPGLGALRPDALTEDVRLRLASELAADLRAGVSDADQGAAHPLELLRIADMLGVDCSDLLPEVAHGLAHALLTDPEATHTPAVRLALEEHFALRTALLGKLDALAAGDPLAAARLLARVPLRFAESQALPHLRMCAEAPRVTTGGGDRATALNAVLRSGGVSVFAEPLVLRTAVRLVWGDDAPTAGEARLMLGDIGSDAHRAAGTSAILIKTALEGPAEDAEVPDLAHDLLRCFTEDLAPRDRASLTLLEFARDLRSRLAGPGWTDRALSLRAMAEPVEPTVLEHAFGALADRVLSEDAPDGELYALIHSGDPGLLAAYGQAARSERVRDRLRTDPAYVAECFTAWSSHPQAGGGWQETRTALLDSVLRPMVRTLPDAHLTSVEHCLERTSVRWADEFRTWNRPGAFGRIGRRLAGRKRKGTPEGHR